MHLTTIRSIKQQDDAETIHFERFDDGFVATDLNLEKYSNKISNSQTYTLFSSFIAITRMSSFNQLFN